MQRLSSKSKFNMIANRATRTDAILVSTLEAETLEALIELRQLTAGIHQAVCTAGPRWMAVGIHIQFYGVTGTAPR